MLYICIHICVHRNNIYIYIKYRYIYIYIYTYTAPLAAATLFVLFERCSWTKMWDRHRFKTMGSFLTRFQTRSQLSHFALLWSHQLELNSSKLTFLQYACRSRVKDFPIIMSNHVNRVRVQDILKIGPYDVPPSVFGGFSSDRRHWTRAHSYRAACKWDRSIVEPAV